VDAVIAELNEITEPSAVAVTAKTLAALAKGAKSLLITDGLTGGSRIMRRVATETERKRRGKRRS
jgi:hypothetical protein